MLKETLGGLKTRAKYFANMENDDTVSDARWNVHINDAIRQYWNLINKTDQDYNLTQATIITENNVGQYDLPDDFLYIRGLDVDFNNSTTNSSTRRASMRPYMWAERNKWRNISYYVTSAFWPYFRYRIHNNSQIWFNPLPQADLTVILYYIPTNPKLVSDTDEMLGINGFDVFISAIAAKVVLDSLSLPSGGITQMAAEWEAMVFDSANNRNHDEPDRVQDVRGKDAYYNY
jgi:hypothetical protein